MGSARTEFALAVEALRESELAYRLLFLDAPIALWEEDFSAVKSFLEALPSSSAAGLRAHLREHPEHVRRCAELVRVVNVNKAGLRLCEAASLEDFRAGLADTFTEESYLVFVEELFALIEGRVSFESEIVRRTLRGRKVQGALRLSLPPGYEKTWSKVLVSIVDLAELKRAESALQESEARFRLAFDFAPIGMAVTALDGRFLQVNRAFCELLGYSEAELLARRFKDVKQAEDVPESEQAASALLAGEVQCVRSEKRYRHKKGHLVWGHRSVSLVRDAAGQPLYFISQIEDFTGRRELEERLRQSEKMEAIGRLAGGIAHDFNNLLTVIRGYAELLRPAVPFDDPRHSPAAEIARAADSAASLVQELLAFGRKQLLQPKILDLNALLTEAQRLLNRVLGEHIQLAIVPDPGLGLVKADPQQLKQVILNLAINARDAMPQGGMLVLETANVELDEEFARRHEGLHEGRYVLLTVTDTGRGMAPETRAHIFEPFFTTKEQGGGAGLGLASVYGIVRQSGGSIWVYSEPGWGTSFKIYLPRVDAAPIRPIFRPRDGTLPMRLETVLLVEDDPGVLLLTRQFLELQGYHVLEARDPGEALEIAQRHPGPINLLLTDVIMPDMDGCRLAERLAKHRPEMKVLYVSGYTQDSLTLQGTLQPGAVLLAKPFTQEGLARVMRQVLDS